MEVTPKQATELVQDTIEAGLVPFLRGSPGLGKSEIMHQIAEKYKLELVDIRLSQLSPEDMSGLPALNGDKATFKPMDLFPLENDPIPQSKTGWLVFLDEMNSAPLSIQSAAYKLILDRMVGNHKLHKNVAIVAAGNKETDKAIVNRMSTATQSRLIHLNLVPDAEEWIDWAENNNIDYRIRAFIGFRPEMLFNFNPNSSDNTFATPRTWVFLNKLIKKYEKEIPSSKLPLMAGTVGEGTAIEFNSFVKIFDQLPNFEQIINNPTGTKVPKDEPPQLYAISGLIAEYATVATFKPILKYINRLPAEFQVITFKSMLKIHPEISKTKTYLEWLKENASKFI